MLCLILINDDDDLYEEDVFDALGAFDSTAGAMFSGYIRFCSLKSNNGFMHWIAIEDDNYNDRGFVRIVVGPSKHTPNVASVTFMRLHATYTAALEKLLEAEHQMGHGTESGEQLPHKRVIANGEYTNGSKSFTVHTPLTPEQFVSFIKDNQL